MTDKKRPHQAQVKVGRMDKPILSDSTDSVGAGLVLGTLILGMTIVARAMGWL